MKLWEGRCQLCTPNLKMFSKWPKLQKKTWTYWYRIWNIYPCCFSQPLTQDNRNNKTLLAWPFQMTYRFIHLVTFVRREGAREYQDMQTRTKGRILVHESARHAKMLCMIGAIVLIKMLLQFSWCRLSCSFGFKYCDGQTNYHFFHFLSAPNRVSVQTEEQQSCRCTTVPVAIVAETCPSFTVLPTLMN